MQWSCMFNNLLFTEGVVEMWLCKEGALVFARCSLLVASHMLISGTKLQVEKARSSKSFSKGIACVIDVCIIAFHER